MTESTFWILLVYTSSAISIATVILVYRAVCHPKFRGEADDSTEAGYEEDGVGRLVHEDDFSTDLEDPHISVPTNSTSSQM